MKWFTHVIWGALVPLLMSSYPMELVLAVTGVHTALTDVLGHTRRGYIVRRAWYHDLLSIALGAVFAILLSDMSFLWLGVIHVVLDYLSPGKLGVSLMWSTMWAGLGLILYTWLIELIHG